MAKKSSILLLFILLLVGCDITMDHLDVTNETKYIVTSKKRKADDFHYTYHLIKEGDKWYDYRYKDTANFNVGDTLVLTIRKVNR